MEELADRKVGVDVDDDDDAPKLSSQALAALQEFLREQNQNETPADQSEVALVTEDWRLSQFWYDRETAEAVANEVLALCSGTPSRVACIACPTLLCLSQGAPFFSFFGFGSIGFSVVEHFFFWGKIGLGFNSPLIIFGGGSGLNY